MNKSTVLEILDQLPPEFSTEDLIDRLLFKEKVEAGIKEVEQGKTVSLEDAEAHFEKKWQTSE